MHEQFHAQKLRNSGYTGPAMDIWKQWLSEQGFVGPIPDAERAWLASKGYTGSLNDQYMALYTAASLTGSIDDMGAAWTPSGGTPPVVPIEDPYYSTLSFYNSMQQYNAEIGGTPTMQGAGFTIAPNGMFGRNSALFVPGGATVNQLQYTQTVGSTSSNAWTVDAWIKIETPPAANSVWIQFWNVPASAVNLQFGITTGGRLSWASSGWGPGGDLLGALPINEWAHVAFVFSPGSLNVYVNGTLTDTVTTPSAIISFNRVSLGGKTNTSALPFTGSLAEVRAVKAVRWTGSSFPVPSGPVLVPTP